MQFTSTFCHKGHYLVIWNVSHGSAGVQELKSWLLNIEVSTICVQVCLRPCH